jgi:hypothetical protein
MLEIFITALVTIIGRAVTFFLFFLQDAFGKTMSARCGLAVPAPSSRAHMVMVWPVAKL